MICKVNIFGLFIYFCVIFVSSFLVGKLLPKKFTYSKGNNILSLTLIYGISIIHSLLLFLMFLRIPIFYISIIYSILVLFSIIYLFKNSVLYKNYFIKKNFKTFLLFTKAKDVFFSFFAKHLYVYLIFFTISIIPFLIIFLKDGLYIMNLGPDYEGHLWSSISLLKNQSLSPLYENLNYLTGSYNQWSLANTWSASSFLDAVGIEFLLRTLRSFHAILPSVLSIIFPYNLFSNVPNHLPLQALILFTLSLTSLLIYEICLLLNLPRLLSVLIGFLISISNSFLIMNYEGITGQLLSTPFYSLLFLIYIFNFRKDPKIDFKRSSILNSLIIITAITSQGEGMQIFFAFSLIFFIIFILQKRHNLIDKNFKKIKLHLLNFKTKENLFSFLIPLPVIIVFFQWSWFRFIQGFSGGALHLNWNPLAISLGMPSVSQLISRNFIPLFSSSEYPRLIFLISLLFIIIVFIKKNNLYLLSLASFLILLLIVSKTGHLYAGFKVAALIQPVFILCIFIILNNTIKEKFNNIISYFLCSSLITLNLNSNINFLKSYNSGKYYVRDSDYIQVCENCSKIDPQLFIFDKDTGKNLRHLILTKNYINATSAWAPSIPIGIEEIDVIRAIDSKDSDFNNANFKLHKFRCKVKDLAEKNGKLKKEITTNFKEIDYLSSKCEHNIILKP